jgi:hypothetical protein
MVRTVSLRLKHDQKTSKKTPAEAGVVYYRVCIASDIIVSKTRSPSRVPSSQDTEHQKA